MLNHHKEKNKKNPEEATSQEKDSKRSSYSDSVRMPKRKIKQARRSGASGYIATSKPKELLPKIINTVAQEKAAKHVDSASKGDNFNPSLDTKLNQVSNLIFESATPLVGDYYDMLSDLYKSSLKSEPKIKPKG